MLLAPALAVGEAQGLVAVGGGVAVAGGVAGDGVVALVAGAPLAVRRRRQWRASAWSQTRRPRLAHLRPRPRPRGGVGERLPFLLLWQRCLWLPGEVQTSVPAPRLRALTPLVLVMVPVLTLGLTRALGRTRTRARLLLWWAA